MLTSFDHPASKIVDSYLAIIAPRGVKSCGEFGVIVKLAQPEKCPPYLNAPMPYSPGHIKARIACDHIDQALTDPNVLSLELLEHVMQ